MITLNCPATDPLGETHILQASLLEGGNWNRESNREDYRRAISCNYQTFAPRDRIAERRAF